MRSLFSYLLALPLLVILINYASIEFEFELYKPEEGYLYGYQNLISGLSALVAAIITVIIMYRNHKDLIQKEHVRAKAYMIDAAVQLLIYSENCLRNLLDEKNNFSEKPDESIKVFKDSIPYVEPCNSKFFKDLVISYQAYNSLLDNYMKVFKENPNNNLTEGMIINTLELRSYALRSLAYAREQELNNSNFLTHQEALNSLRVTFPLKSGEIESILGKNDDPYPMRLAKDNRPKQNY